MVANKIRCAMHNTMKNTLTPIRMGVLGFVALVFVTGFVPQDTGFEIRRKSTYTVENVQKEHLPLPITNNKGFSMRAAVSKTVLRHDIKDAKDFAKRSEDMAYTSSAPWLEFSSSGVHFVPAPAQEKSIAARLIEPSYHQGVAQVPDRFLGYGEPLTHNGEPLRFSKLQNTPVLHTNSLVCAPERPSLASLQKTLIERAYVPRAGESLLSKAKRYEHLVDQAAKRFNLRKDLIFAIIQTESDFSPTLVSSQSAMGLMQLLPSTAGGEVHRFLYGRSASLGLSDLSKPDLNILFGTAYFHLLLTRHLNGVTNRESREYCAMAAYNMGIGRLIRFFGNSREEAFAAINNLSSNEVYTRLTTVLPIAETRNYVARVTHRQSLYKDFM